MESRFQSKCQFRKEVQQRAYVRAAFSSQDGMPGFWIETGGWRTTTHRRKLVCHPHGLDANSNAKSLLRHWRSPCALVLRCCRFTLGIYGNSLQIAKLQGRQLLRC